MPESDGRRFAGLRLVVVAVLMCAAGLAGIEATGDSVTVDEPAHLVAGYAALTRSDYRLSPDHPPLGRMALVLPLLALPVSWRAEETPAWTRGDFFTIGRSFFEEWNDGERLVKPSRAVAIALLIALLLALASAGRELFGASAGVLAMALAAFDPNLLAHGHLATLDVPFTLCALLTLLTAHRWLAEAKAATFVPFAAAFTAATLVKFSWLPLIPALIVMAVASRRGFGTPRRTPDVRVLVIGGVALAAIAWLGIWAAYGFRYRAATGADRDTATMHVLGDYGRPLPRTPDAAWESVLHDPITASDRPGLAVPLVRALRALRLLPEAYLYGAAYVDKKADGRAAYLRGEYSREGFLDYFAWVYATKTPIPTLILVVAGMSAGLWRWWRGDRPSPLTVGLLAFSAIYLATLVTSGLNLGYRHLLPVTALATLAAGNLIPFAKDASRVRNTLRFGLAAAFLWLCAGTVGASSRLLGYFNEAAGGWRQGHFVLAESNIDWGQNLLRLRERLRTEPRDAVVWLAQAGDPPRPSGLDVRWLVGEGSHAPSPGRIAGGIYILSTTELLGVYRPLARAEAWRDPRLLADFEKMSDEHDRTSAQATDKPADAFEALRRLRLIAALSARAPDERIGTSLFLFRLSDRDVAELIGGGR